MTFPIISKLVFFILKGSLNHVYDKALRKFYDVQYTYETFVVLLEQRFCPFLSSLLLQYHNVIIGMIKSVACLCSKYIHEASFVSTIFSKVVRAQFTEIKFKY